MPFFRTREGHRLIYTTAGPRGASPLLMIHGWLSHRGVWRQTVEAFQDRYHCIAVDLLGFGESDKPTEGDYCLEAQGQRLLALADALGVKQFTLLGHSMGGQIALYLVALLAPERVTQLVLVSSVVSGRLQPLVEDSIYPQIALGAMCPGLYSLWHEWARHPACAYLLFRPWFYAMESIPFEHWAVDRAMALQPEIHLSAYKTGQAIRQLDLTAHLAKVSVPTLAIFGRQDAIVPVSDVYRLKQHVPNSRLVMLERCGHFPMYEQTKPYLAALRTFLDKPSQEPG